MFYLKSVLCLFCAMQEFLLWRHTIIRRFLLKLYANRFSLQKVNFIFVNSSKTEDISVLIIISVVEISSPFVHAHKIFVLQNDVAVEVRLWGRSITLPPSEFFAHVDYISYATMIKKTLINHLNDFSLIIIGKITFAS